jgi:predicted O-methyltransferase YrrM
MQHFLVFLTLALVAVAVLLMALTLHKVRRVHQNCFDLLDHARATRTEVESLFSQLQSLTQLDRTLALPQGLPPMRGWAGSPDFLLFAARHVLTHKPAVAVECGSGVSTVVLARCMQMVGRGRVYSLEHEAIYAGKTRELLREHGLEAWAEVIEAPLTVAAGSTPWYDDSKCPASLRDIDLLVVDGPPDHIARMARYPALPRLLPRMAPQFTVIVDDAARPDETEMVTRWTQEIPGIQSSTATAEKGLAVVWR